ncbi:hypothetical protein [Sulfitobacter sp.]|uniref:hypothetical protein n=1 Tax=Sulfitobacter sp. TaxID=1903071 RepID=UPI0030018CDD
MKPNFALSLSFEGIKLLHRAAGGWREVGEVAVAAEDLAGELAMLRKTAASLEPGGVRSKLIIPSSQIKYLTIETIGLSDAARRKETEAALENATPYDVADLAYDMSLDGAKTHVAAVARETLAEAEAFATEHRFHPVSFVAVPDDAPYLGEPFFGVTEGADALLEPGDEVEPDGIAVVVVGAVAPTSEPETLTAEAAEPAEPASDKFKAEQATETALTEPKAQPELELKPEPKHAPTPVKKSEPVVASKSEAPAANPLPKLVDAATAEPVAKPALKAETPPVVAPMVKSAPQPALPSQAASKPKNPAPAVDPVPKETPTATTSAAPAITAPAKASDPEKVAVTAPVVATPATKPSKTSFDIAPKAPAGEATGFSSRRTGAAKPLGGAQRIVVSTPKPDSSSLTKPAAVADRPEPKPAKTSFLSRRKIAATPVPAPAAAVPQTGSEAERMTVFGARSDQVGGKPRFLGLIMTVILLVFLAGVAAWAAVFLDDGLAGLIKSDERRTAASAPENQIDPEIIRTPDGLDNGSPPAGEDVQVAALDPVLSAEDTAVLDAIQDARPEPQRPVITEQEAAARYAVSGIWPLAPTTPLNQPDTVVESIYYSSVDPVSTASDALALPALALFDTDVQIAALVSPPPFGQRTSMNAAGLITPTPEGVVAPGGYTLIASSPPRKPPAAISRSEAEPVVAAVAAVASPLLEFRPKNRPLGLAERTERAQLGGVTRIELASFRPSLRPRSLQDRARQAEEAKLAAEEARLEASAAAAAALALPQPTTVAAVSPLKSATRFATSQSRRPDTRPRNFDRIVKRAQRATPAATETRVAAAAAVAPRTVAPSIPSKTSVARSATVKNAINLRKVNLIGVYGKPSSRRALVRLSNGRYQKVKVGDRIDGGRVAAISTSELRYTKGGRNVVLQMP